MWSILDDERFGSTNYVLTPILRDGPKYARKELRVNAHPAGWTEICPISVHPAGWALTRPAGIFTDSVNMIFAYLRNWILRILRIQKQRLICDLKNMHDFSMMSCHDDITYTEYIYIYVCVISLSLISLLIMHAIICIYKYILCVAFRSRATCRMVLTKHKRLIHAKIINL